MHPTRCSGGGGHRRCIGRLAATALAGGPGHGHRDGRSRSVRLRRLRRPTGAAAGKARRPLPQSEDRTAGQDEDRATLLGLLTLHASPYQPLLCGKTRRSTRRALILHQRATTLDCRTTALGPKIGATRERSTIGVQRRCEPRSWHDQSRRRARLAGHDVRSPTRPSQEMLTSPGRDARAGRRLQTQKKARGAAKFSVTPPGLRPGGWIASARPVVTVRVGTAPSRRRPTCRSARARYRAPSCRVRRHRR